MKGLIPWGAPYPQSPAEAAFRYLVVIRSGHLLCWGGPEALVMVAALVELLNTSRRQPWAN